MIEGENEAKKPDSMKTDQEKKDEGIKIEKNKTFMIIAGVLFVLIVAIGGYLIWRNMSGSEGSTGSENETVDNAGSITKQEYDQLNSQLTSCQSELSVAEDCDVREGSKIQKDFDLGQSYVVSLVYPNKYYHMPMMLTDNSPFNFYYRLGVDYPSGTSEYGEEIIAFTDVSLHNDAMSTPEDYEEIEIAGDTYMIKVFKNGDGGIGGRSFTTFYEVMIEDDLYVTVQSVDELNYVECAPAGTQSTLPECSDDPDVLYEYKTTEAQLEEALEVLELMTLTRL